MAYWVKCTAKDNEPIFVNLDIASSVKWRERSKLSRVAFPGGVIDFIDVKERPEAFLSARELKGQ